MRFKIAIILTLIIPNIMKSQSATATLENALSCSGQSVLVGCDVTNFIDVAAMTIYIGYDTNEAEFVSLQNVNPAVTGYLTTNASNGQIGIAYSNVNPFNLSSGKLFDLQFNFIGDSTYLPFNPGTEIANSNLEIIPLDTYPGSITNGIVIIDQPDSVQAYPDSDVTFSVTTSGNVTYQWQEDSGNGWYDLQNNQTYNGVTNDTLSILDVPLSYNGFIYRCIVSDASCNDTTAVALLEVATAYPSVTLASQSVCPGYLFDEPIFAGDLYNIVEFTFIISFNQPELNIYSIENINPLLGTNINTIVASQLVTVHWEDVNPVTITSGKLFDLIADYSSGIGILNFEEGSEIINSQLNTIDATYINGSILSLEHPEITQQPQDITVTEGDDALFKVTATNATGYQWKESVDSGYTWTDLSEGSPYYGVTSPQLTISPVSLEMNGYLYSCNVENEYCSVLSNPAMLSVDSLDYIGDIVLMPLFATVEPNPFRDNLNIAFDRKCTDLTINIYGIQGNLMFSRVAYLIKSDRITIDLSGLPCGLFVLELTGKYQDSQFIETRKIIKRN